MTIKSLLVFLTATWLNYVADAQDPVAHSQDFLMGPDSEPENDKCPSAIELIPGRPMTPGKITSHTTRKVWCGGGSQSWMGVWYKVQGTGNVLTVSTCHARTDYRSDLFVQAGCTAGAACVDAQMLPIENCGNKGKSVSWQSESGKDYRIFVGGDLQFVEGKFGIYIQEHFDPANNECGNAPLLTPNADDPTWGSTLLATNNPFCPDGAGSTSTGENYPGVYYKVQGTGNRMVVSTCFPYTNFGTMIKIQNGCGADDAPGCVGQLFDLEQELKCTRPYGSVTVFDSEPGKEYIISLTGSWNQARGSYAIKVTELFRPPNDVCAAAVNIAVSPGTTSEKVSGNTVAALESPWCSASTANWRILYYTVTGTGGLMTATTCHDETEYATSVTVAMGDCATGGLQCVPEAMVDVPCNDMSKGDYYSWISTPGQVYYIMVSGHQKKDAGTFFLTVSSYATPNNADCSSSSVPTLTVNGNNEFGTIKSASMQPVYCSWLFDAGNANGDYASVWYKVIGNGGQLVVATCTQHTTFSAELAIQDGCTSAGGGAKCLETQPEQADYCNGDHQGTARSFASVDGATYYIQVSEQPQASKTLVEMGDFAIKVYDKATGQSGDSDKVDTCFDWLYGLCKCKKLQRCVTQAMSTCEFTENQGIARTEQEAVQQRVCNVYDCNNMPNYC